MHIIVRKIIAFKIRAATFAFSVGKRAALRPTVAGDAGNHRNSEQKPARDLQALGVGESEGKLDLAWYSLAQKY